MMFPYYEMVIAALECNNGFLHTYKVQIGCMLYR